MTPHAMSWIGDWGRIGGKSRVKRPGTPDPSDGPPTEGPALSAAEVRVFAEKKSVAAPKKAK